MNETTKKCPMCAEEIKIEATTCEYCGAQFEVTSTGYCQNCHEVRDADENGQCKVCGNKVVDLHVQSRHVEEQPSTPASVIKIPKRGTPGPKSSRPNYLTPVILISAVGIGLYLLLQSTGLNPFAPSSTPIPRPTRTSTPMPVEVNFTSIHDYPLYSEVNIVGQLLLPGSMQCGEECGVFLRNPTKYHERITVFLFIPLAGNTPLPNQMARLPSEYYEQDFEVRLDDGNYVGNYATVRITGSICETTDGDIAICTISKIESAQPPASTPTTTLENIPTPFPTVVDNPEMPTPSQAANSPTSGTGIAVGRILWNGQPMAGVTVKLCTNLVWVLGCQTTEYNAITDNDGRYTIAGLPVGDYDFATITPGQKGESDYFDRKVTVVAGQTVTVQDTNVIKYDLKLTSPDNDATVRSNTPTLEWEAYPDAAYYRVYVLQLDWQFDFITKVVVDSENVSAPQYIFQSPLASDKYSWSIYAYNADGIEISASRSDSYLEGQSYYFLVAP